MVYVLYGPIEVAGFLATLMKIKTSKMKTAFLVIKVASNSSCNPCKKIKVRNPVIFSAFLDYFV